LPKKTEVRSSEYLVTLFYLKQNKMEEKQITLDEVNVTWIIDTLTKFREAQGLEFENTDADNSYRLSCAQDIIECDNMIIYLKEQLYEK
jgi:hypothetical protein